jgi:Lanthionine synthetase C-like protein
VLYSPDAHEPVVEVAWDAQRVRAGIRAIAEDAERAFDDGWPVHPFDDDVPSDPLPARPQSVYLGGAGVVQALHELARRGLVDIGRDYLPYVDRPYETDLPAWGAHPPSLWIGETGIRLVLQRISPSAENADRLAELVAANVQDTHRELMWGSPGSMLAARAMHGLTGDERWLELWRQSATWLRGSFEPGTGVWTQELYGRESRYLGPVHGFAGCVLALAAEHDGELDRRAAATASRYAVEQDGLANWPPVADPSVRLEIRDGQPIRTQWCHGAPGIVACLARMAADDEEFGQLMVAGGGLTWRAGPLAKGANLCHGTAGNGYAFLALHRRTGDELWLARARAFAMHALAQVERWRSEFGRGRYSLWTGDLGTALYLADCLDGDGDLPLP